MSQNKLIGSDGYDLGYRKSNKDNFIHGGLQKFKSRKKYTFEEQETKSERCG